MKKFPLVICFVTALIAFVLGIVSVATTSWIKYYSLNDAVESIPASRAGLFYACNNIECVLSTDLKRTVTIAFVSLTFFLLVMALLLTFIALLGTTNLARAAGGMYVATVFISLFTVSYYGGFYLVFHARYGYLGYSFGLACAVVPLCIISAVLAFVAE